MARCVIIGAGELDADFLSDFSWREDDYIICADGGLYHAQQAGIRPDLLIGDQDSFVEGFPKGIPALTCRPEKDDSDMMLAVKEGISRGYEDFVLLGATGGFILGFLLAAVLAAVLRRLMPTGGFVRDVATALLAIACSHAVGVCWLATAGGYSLAAAFAAGSAPFIVLDAIKACVGVGLAKAVRAAVPSLAA